jgi:hypothetical protein
MKRSDNVLRSTFKIEQYYDSPAPPRTPKPPEPPRG